MTDKDTIMLPREVVQEALEALEFAERHNGGDDCYADSITALRTHLAAEQPKPEPVAWMRKEWSPDCGSYFDFCAEEEMGWRDRKEWTPLYATPPATHPGYVIGSHWLETAYSRICAGEAEADVLRDCGWERMDDAEALRRDAERYRWLRGEHSRIDPCIKANAKYRLERDSSTWVNIHDLDAAIDAAMKEGT